MARFIVTYRTGNGPVRLETIGYSWREVRALYSLIAGIEALCVQEVRS